MGRVSIPLTNFNGGEWSPELMGRYDLQKYQNACQRIENFIPTVLGKADRRTGSRFVNATKNDGVVRLINFEYSTVQAYVIEVGNLYMRFYRNKGRLESPPGTPVEIVTPWSTADLPELKWVQSADVMYIVHPSYAPRKLSRLSSTSFQLSIVDLRDGPYLDENITATTLTFGSATINTSTTVTASASLFAATDVGRLIRIRSASAASYAVITAFTSATVVTVTNLTTIVGSGSKNWRLGAFSGTTGYPSTVTLNEERLVFANTVAQPQTLWMSVSGDYELFQPTGVIGDTPINLSVNADNAITFTLSDDRVNAIQWMSSGNTLLVGTTGSEVSVQASSLNEAITPSNITGKRHSTVGSSKANAIRINETVIYIQRNKKRIFEVAYDFESNGYKSNETAIFSRHLLRGKVKEIVYQQEPYNLIWYIDEAGKLFSLTFNKEQDVRAPARQPIAGANAKVLSITSIIGDGQNELWLVSERTINGNTHRYIEYLEYEYIPDDANDKAKAVYLDSSLEYVGAPTSNLSGLDHLIGETVSIWDGSTHPDKVVNGAGQIILDRPVTHAQVGLNLVSIITTVPFEGGVADGAALGKKKRLNKVPVQLLNTLGGKIGTSINKLEPILFRNPNDPMDNSPPLYTGIKLVEYPEGWEEQPAVTIVQDQPGPMTVLSMAPRMTAMEA